MRAYPLPKDAVIQVAEARAGLPGLLKRLERGGAPICIGPRGRATAVLIGIDEYDALVSRTAGRPAPIRTWKDLGCEWLGDGPAEAKAISPVGDGLIERELERTERLVLVGPLAPKRAPKKVSGGRRRRG